MQEGDRLRYEEDDLKSFGRTIGHHFDSLDLLLKNQL